MVESEVELRDRGAGGGTALRRLLEPAVPTGRSLRAWKLRGLRPRTMIAPDRDSQMGTLTLLAR